MKPLAVQFGAGNIGRGFIAQLFHESGYRVAFVDVVPEVLDALNCRGQYTIHIVGPDACDVTISDVVGVDGRDREAAADIVAQCDVACTAVGASALRHIAPVIAAGLERRLAAGAAPLNVLVCENLHEAGDHLRRLVSDCLPPSTRDEALGRTGFVQAVVSRMVPIQPADARAPDPLAVRVEAYKRLPVDSAAIVGRLPSITGVEPVANFAAYEARKLYTHNCAHASLGYLGWLAGYDLAYEALAEPSVRVILDTALAETSDALVARFGFDLAEHRTHVQDLLRRFQNTELGDDCFRLARDPVRKLAPADRLVGAARLCQDAGTAPNALAFVIASAFRFDAPDDPVAVNLQKRIADDGLGNTMLDVAGIASGEPLGTAVGEDYALLAEISAARREGESPADATRSLAEAWSHAARVTQHA